MGIIGFLKVYISAGQMGVAWAMSGFGQAT